MRGIMQRVPSGPPMVSKAEWYRFWKGRHRRNVEARQQLEANEAEEAFDHQPVDEFFEREDHLF